MIKTRKKQIVIDSSGNEVECVTVYQAAKLCNMTVPELKLVMYKNKWLPYYKLMGRARRRVIRIKREDLVLFTKTQDFFDNISDKIVEARKAAPVYRIGMTQIELAKEIGLTNIGLCYIERKLNRVGLKTLEKIAKAVDKPLDWFLS